jgi:hypothetical protein
MNRLIPTWAKDPRLAGSDLLIVSGCLGAVWPEALATASRDRVVLTVCPEAENVAVVYGKLASMIRSGRPRSISVLTVECSPHCFTLHAAVLEALYIAQAQDLPLSLAVCHAGEIKPISPVTVRVARYLHLLDGLVRQHPEIEEQLRELSLEHRAGQRCG